MDHNLATLSSTCSSVSTTATAPAGTAFKPSAGVAANPAASRQLKAGHAITLRAKELSVLRIAHGRVWATLSNVGPYSRVPGGDHFLSRGESLTLLPGQELVMESFGIGHSPTALFNWEDACAAAIALPVLDARAQAHTDGVVQPLRDLRHALGLVAGASGRLVNGLANGVVRGAVTALEAVPTNFAMVFVAARNRKAWASSTFDAEKGRTSAQLADCRSV